MNKHNEVKKLSFYTSDLIEKWQGIKTYQKKNFALTLENNNIYKLKEQGKPKKKENEILILYSWNDRTLT